MKIYLDVCCYNRPFDDQTQERIHLEAEAVLIILSNISKKKWALVGSDVVDLEISKILDLEREKKVKFLSAKILQKQKINSALIERAKLIEQKGIQPLDALHIASAECIQAEYLITTDDNLVKKYSNNTSFFKNIKICNPIVFLSEVL
jgi:predicted nucleic acid-binding protein